MKKIKEVLNAFEAKLNLKKIGKATLILGITVLVIVVLNVIIKDLKEKKAYNDVMLQVDNYVNKKQYDKAIKKLNYGAKKFKNKENYISEIKNKKADVKKIKEKNVFDECIEIAESDNVDITDEDRIDAYTKAIDIKPAEEELYMSAAAIYVQYNDYDKAVKLLSSGVDACEEIDGKKSKESAIHLTKKIDEINEMMFSEEYNTMYLEAKSAYEEGDFDKVLLNYNQCLIKNKNDARLYVIMAKAYFDINKYNEAIKTLDTGIDRIRAIGGSNKRSKQYNNYRYLVKLKNNYNKIQKISNKYDSFYKGLLLGCKKLKESNDITSIKKTILKNDFKTISGCNKVTYYTDKGMYVEQLNSGIGIAVYNNGYIYYGEWKDGEKSGDGYYMAVSKTEDNTLIYLYHGAWNGDYPNGKGKIVYECYGEEILKYKTVTEGIFINGFEDGNMTITKKTKDSEYGELSMKYKCNKGQPVVIKEKGKMKKSADGSFVIGYYYDKSDKKREIASIPNAGGQPKKVLWMVSGLQK